MALVVELLERDLHMVFVSALEQLCPGSGFKVSKAGVISRSTTTGCTEYCDHGAACNLIDALIDAPGTTTLALSGYGNGFNQKNTAKAQNGQVSWRPDATLSDTNWCGGRRTLPVVILAHELVHALQNQLKTISNEDETEDEAVRGENQIRRALCQPLRVKYGKREVADYAEPYLDSADKRNCICGAERSDWEQILEDLRCAAHGALTCLLERLDTAPSPTFVQHRGAEELARDLDGAGGVVARRVQTARETLAISPHAAYVHAIAEQSFQQDPFCVSLEAVGLNGEYGVVLVHPVEGSLRVVTNLMFGGGTDYFVSGPSDLMEYVFDTHEGFAQEISDITYQPGVGGETNQHGGVVQFLHMKAADSDLMNAALYGYQYAAFDGPSEDPGGIDSPRWAAVTEIYSITQGLMAQSASRSGLIARRI